MRKTIVSVLVVALLSSCGGFFVEETPMIGADGSRMYLIKNFVGADSSKEYSQIEMAKRASEICPTGYDLIDEEMIHRNHFLTQTKAPLGRYLHWQIRCKNPQSPPSKT